MWAHDGQDPLKASIFLAQILRWGLIFVPTQRLENMSWLSIVFVFQKKTNDYKYTLLQYEKYNQDLAVHVGGSIQSRKPEYRNIRILQHLGFECST